MSSCSGAHYSEGMKSQDESSAHPSYRGWRSLRDDVNGANIAAGVTAGLWYAFGAIPIQLEAAASFHLTPEAASSWFFIIWFTGAVSSILFTLRYRQPLAITWTIPGLVFLATLSDRYTLPEIAGASLAAGLMIVALGFLGVGARLMRWLPLPIVMGMFAGSILGYATGIFEELGAQPWVVGAAIVGYLGARARPNLAPSGGWCDSIRASGCSFGRSGTSRGGPLEPPTRCASGASFRPRQSSRCIGTARRYGNRYRKRAGPRHAREPRIPASHQPTYDRSGDQLHYQCGLRGPSIDRRAQRRCDPCRR